MHHHLTALAPVLVQASVVVFVLLVVVLIADAVRVELTHAPWDRNER